MSTDIKKMVVDLTDLITKLVEDNNKLKDDNAVLKMGNDGFTNTLKYYAALVGKLEQNVDSLKKTINEMNGVSKWTEVEV
jgi:hypothetical protein